MVVSTYMAVNGHDGVGTVDPIVGPLYERRTAPVVLFWGHLSVLSLLIAPLLWELSALLRTFSSVFVTLLT